MTDHLERLLTERVTALLEREPTSPPADWSDVLRRSRPERRTPSAAKFRRRRIVGALAATAAGIGLVGILWTSTATNPATIPAGSQLPVVSWSLVGAGYKVNSTLPDVGMADIMKMRSDVVLDLDRRIARVTTSNVRVGHTTTTFETIVTPTETFGRVPVGRRDQTGGRAWVKAPSNVSSGKINFSPDFYVAPLRGVANVFGLARADWQADGTSTSGPPITIYHATAALPPASPEGDARGLTIGVDDLGRLAFVSAFMDGTGKTQYRYDHARDLELPPETAVYAVEDIDAADRILGAALSFP